MIRLNFGFVAMLASVAIATSAYSETVRHDRGVKTKVIRSSQQQSNTIVFEKKGPLGVSDVARLAWAGEPIRTQAMPVGSPPAISPTPSQKPMTWQDLQASQDSHFDLIHARMNF